MEWVFRRTSYQLNGAGNETTIAFIMYQVSKFIYLCISISLDKTVSREITFPVITSQLRGNEAGRPLTYS